MRDVYANRGRAARVRAMPASILRKRGAADKTVSGVALVRVRVCNNVDSAEMTQKEGQTASTGWTGAIVGKEIVCAIEGVWVHV